MESAVDVVSASYNNLEEILSIEEKSFQSEKFSRRQFRYLIKSENAPFFIAKKNQKTAGYLILLTRKNSHKLRIYSIAVDPNFRGLKIGQTLLNHAILVGKSECFKSLMLEVSEVNTTAINLYKKFGFAVKGKRLNYYGDGNNALIMEINLP